MSANKSDNEDFLRYNSLNSSKLLENSEFLKRLSQENDSFETDKTEASPHKRMGSGRKDGTEFTASNSSLNDNFPLKKDFLGRLSDVERSECNSFEGDSERSMAKINDANRNKELLFGGHSLLDYSQYSNQEESEMDTFEGLSTFILLKSKLDYTYKIDMFIGQQIMFFFSN